jgi:hypothetical protein
MNRLSLYQQDIVAATGCDGEDAERIEDIMLNHIVRSTLDGLRPDDFAAAARAAGEWFSELLEMGWIRVPGGGLEMPRKLPPFPGSEKYPERP